MFGLMRTRDHEATVAQLRADHAAALARAEADADGWRFLATKLAGDLLDLQKRMVPVLIEAEPGESSVDEADADHSPSGKERRQRAKEMLS